MRDSQRGFSILLAAVILIIIVGVVFAIIALFGHQRSEGAVAQAAARLSRAEEALEQFASASGRLPCPANPALDTGDADPLNPLQPCNSPTGTLPWHTIGLARDDSFDSWGWRISYRVYTGAAGSLTQPNGASMALCDTNTLSSPGLGAGGICQGVRGWYTKDSEYLAGKGLPVTDFGVPHLDAAYVLVSHGPSGLGAYTASGSQKPLPANPDELANTTATGPFIARAASSPDIAADDAAHFDDVLAYRTLQDFVNRARLAARDWPDPALASVRADTATVSAAVGTSVSPGSEIGPSVVFNNATVTASAGGTAENVSFDVVGGTEGIGGGGGGGGGTQLSSADSEVLSIEFNVTAQVFAFTLDGFGCRSSCADADQVQLTFYMNDVAVASGPVMLSACNDGDGLASFSIDRGPSPGGDFNRVDIAPKPSVPGGIDTTILMSEFKTCLAGGGCATSLDTGSGPGGNHCP